MNNNDAAALARAPDSHLGGRKGAPAPAISTTAEAIKPFRQLRQHHEINDSFRLDLRQGGGRKAELHVGQLLWVMGVCSE